MKFYRTFLIASISFYLIFGISPGFCECPDHLTYGQLDMAHIQAVGKKVTAKKYPNADVVHIDQNHWIAYNPDGTYTEWNAHAVKILSEKGKRQFQTISSYFTVPYNTTEFKRIVIIRPDGSHLPIDIEKNSRVTIEHGQMQKNIYNPNQKILRVSIPQLAIGDILYTEMLDLFDKVRTPDTWSDYIGMESTYPIVRMRYQVCAPVERPLERIVIKNEIPGTIVHNKTQNDEHIIYQWVAENVPQAFAEPDMPPLYSQIQRLLLSTVKEWSDISKWYWQLCKVPIDETTPEMSNIVKELTRNSQNDMENIKQIFFWVSQKIRYLGLTVEKEAPGYEPHPVKMTFERRAGVCRDKAALLVSMLRLAGFEAFPVLIMNGPKKDPEVPQPFFNHAVSCVLDADGKYILMDATDENTRELFPTYLNDQSYLVARPDGDILRTSPVAKASENMMIIQTQGNLDSNGQLFASCQLTFEGINDNAYRGYFSNISSEERQSFLENLVKNIAPGAILNQFDIQPKDMRQTDKPLCISIEFQASDIRIQDNDMVMLPVFQVGTSIGIVRHLIGKMGLKKRKYPLKTHYPCGVKEHLDLNLASSVGQLIRAPGYQNINTESMTYQRSMTVKNNHLTGDYVFMLKKPEYAIDEYADILKNLEIIEQNTKKMPIFRSHASLNKGSQMWYTPTMPDALILNERVYYNIENYHQWIETRKLSMKILTYAGKKKFSDIQIPYHPSWEDVQITKATVTQDDGSITQINPDEINTMDASWAGDAPRYPASKTLVVSFPGVDINSIINYTLIRKIKYRPFFSNMTVSPIYPTSQPLNEYPVQQINSFFRYRVPIEKKSVTFSFPDPMQIHFQKYVKGFSEIANQAIRIHEKQSRKSNINQYTYTAEKINSIKPEQFLPPWYSFNPMITATSHSWQTYAQHLYARMILALQDPYETRQKAKDLTDELPTINEKVKAIRDFVASHIRLIPIAVNDIDIRHLTPSDQTLKDGYGHSLDCAIVLYAMIQSIGLSPEFVLVSNATNHFKDAMQQLPSPQWIYNLLISIKLDNRTIYLNDTDQYAHIGTTPYQGRYGLRLPHGTIFQILPQSKQFQDNAIEKYTIDLKASGAAIITRTCAYFGMSHARFHKKMAEMPPEKQNRYHQQLISNISQSARPHSPYITHIDTYPATEVFSVSVNPYAIRDRNYVYFEIPGFSQGLAGVREDNRSHPLYRPYYSRKDVCVDIQIPKQFQSMITPGQHNLWPENAENTITMKTSQHAHRMRIDQHINISPVLIQARQYGNFVEIHNQLRHMGTRMVLFDVIR